jgi:hypothetical protein
MRSHRLTHAVLFVLAVASLTILAQGTAEADPVCEVLDPRTGVCRVWAQPDPPPGAEPISDGGSDSGSSSSGGSSSGTSTRTCTFGDTEVPCSPSGYTWNASRECYAQIADPQPAADDPVWEGNTDGVIMACIPPYCVVEGLGLDDCYNDLYWAPTAPAAGPSPGELADRAVDSMNLHAIQIGIVPKPGADSIGLVGMPTWMWAADPGPSTTGPITASASGGGITVTATARLEGITWDMGDGNTVVCTGPGTPYNANRGREQSPDCGHVYTTTSAGRPGDKFTVSASSDWVITWAGGGQSGTIRMEGLTESVQIAVGEAQVLVTN